MKTCRTCFYCVPNYKGGSPYFYRGTCYQSNRKVLASMTACNIHKEREENMTVKSTTEKRNKYKDKDGNSMPGVTIPEILEKPLTILAKREYTWGQYKGLAVKVMGDNGNLAIVEITAEIPIKALCGPKSPKPPFAAKFVQRTSKNKKKYYTVEEICGDESGIPIIEENLPF